MHILQYADLDRDAASRAVFEAVQIGDAAIFHGEDQCNGVDVVQRPLGCDRPGERAVALEQWVNAER